MFTGIIEKKAKILSISSGKFEVENCFIEELELGQSIAHDGACMSITEIQGASYCFFVMQESFDKSNFSEKKIGDYFNIERCMKLGGRLDGHMVSGHIDTTGVIDGQKKLEDDSLILEISFDSAFSQYTIEKGSIAINGVSLTIVNCAEGKVSVSLIPLTQDWTNLGEIETGEIVNIEFDLIAKYISKQKY